MKLLVVQVLLVVAVATKTSADIGDFFDNLLSVFKPAGNGTESSVTEAGNTTAGIDNYNLTEHTTSVTTFLNATTVSPSPVEISSSSESASKQNMTPKNLLDVTVRSESTSSESSSSQSSSSEEDSSEENSSTTIDPEYLTTVESTTAKLELNTTTVVFHLFHPNTTTTTSTEATTAEATNSTDNSTTSSVDSSSLEASTNSSEIKPSTEKRVASLTISETALPASGPIASPLASYKLSGGVTCSFSVNVETNSLVVSCNNSSPGPNTGSSTSNVTDYSSSTIATPPHNITGRGVAIVELPYAIIAFKNDSSESSSDESDEESITEGSKSTTSTGV